jgi:hypothetical protein
MYRPHIGAQKQMHVHTLRCVIMTSKGSRAEKIIFIQKENKSLYWRMFKIENQKQPNQACKGNLDGSLMPHWWYFDAALIALWCLFVLSCQMTKYMYYQLQATHTQARVCVCVCVCVCALRVCVSLWTCRNFFRVLPKELSWNYLFPVTKHER